ncbi:hypothetical protein ES705_24750 [subsurface metagenome]
MKKELKSIVMVSILWLSVIACLPLTAVGVEQTELSIEDVSVASGETGITSIMINVTDPSGLGAATINLTYDPSVCVVTNVVKGPSSFDSLTSTHLYTNTSGYVRMVAYQSESLTGVGPGLIKFADVTFKAVGGDSSTLNLIIETLKNNTGKPVPYTVTTGTVTITGVENQPPNEPNEPLPEDGATNVTTSPTLSVLVSDPDGDSMTVTFYNDSDDNVIDSVTGVASGTRASVIWSGLENVTEYSWYVKANDSELENGSDTWSFTTVAEGVGIHDIDVTWIKIIHDTTEIPEGDNLTIGETYNIRYRVNNDGDFGESEVNITVKLANETGETTLREHTVSINAGIGGTYTFTTWDTTGLTADDYTITVNASIPVDNNPGNNEKTRAVTLVTVAIDGTAPTTNVTAPEMTEEPSPIPSGHELNWTNEDKVVISFRRTDNVGGNPSGVNYTNLSTTGTAPWTMIYYNGTINDLGNIGLENISINDTTPIPYNFTINVTAEGTTEIYYYSVDNATNDERDELGYTPNVTVRIDRVAPTIDVVSPASGAPDVPVTTDIVAHFVTVSPMNSSTLTTDTVIVVNSTDSPVTGAVTYDDATQNVTFDPADNLAYNEIYNVTITTGVKDLAGNAMESNYSWEFTTAIAAVNNPPTLTNDQVSPTTGDIATTFYFNVTYTDADNETATYVNVTIAGIQYEMSEVNLTDVDVTDGKNYTYSTLLSAGTHEFNFTASDGIAVTTTASKYVTVTTPYDVELTVDGEKVAARTTAPGENATYTLSVNNTGTAMDNYTLSVDNPESAIVSLSTTGITNLPAGENETVFLYVKNASDGIFPVNVTATSDYGPTDYVNTTTTVITAPAYDVNLTVNTTAQEVAPDVNATYLLTVNNTGDVADNYTLTVDNNVSNADIAVLNRTTITNLAVGANTTVLLNVTDATKGVFIVDVTVTSDTDSNVNDTVSTRTIVMGPEDSKYTIHLKPEYQNISAPLNDTSITDARSLINKINEQGGNCTEFISWNGTAWLSYAPPDDPLNNVTIKGGEGYFVHVTRESDVTFIGTAWEN